MKKGVQFWNSRASFVEQVSMLIYCYFLGKQFLKEYVKESHTTSILYFIKMFDVTDLKLLCNKV